MTKTMSHLLIAVMSIRMHCLALLCTALFQVWQQARLLLGIDSMHVPPTSKTTVSVLYVHDYLCYLCTAVSIEHVWYICGNVRCCGLHAQVQLEMEAAAAKAASEETSRQRDLPDAVLQDLQEVNAALR